MNSRKTFIKQLSLATAGISIFPAMISPNTPDEKKEILNTELVKEFVVSCHNDLEKAKELYTKEPKLIFSSHDWGNGDFESGIEGAGHMGNIDTVNFLLSKGARVNFFTLCMLGKTEVVTAILKDFPEMVNAKGPHGFTPLHHANKGGSNALTIKELLLSLGAVETKISL